MIKACLFEFRACMNKTIGQYTNVTAWSRWTRTRCKPGGSMADSRQNNGAH